MPPRASGSTPSSIPHTPATRWSGRSNPPRSILISANSKPASYKHEEVNSRQLKVEGKEEFKKDRQFPMQRFTELQVWQRGHSLVLSVYRMTTGFPQNERYGFHSQLRRQAISVPSI